MITRGEVVMGLTVVCAAAGALVGARVWGLDLGDGPSLAVLAGGTLLGVVVAFGLLTAERAPERPEAVPPQVQAPPPAGYARPAPEPPPTTPPTTTNTRTWWAETPGRAAAVRPEDRSTPLSSYEADRAVVAQCPRCGDFRLDVEQGADAYAFHCRNPNCGHRWEWRAGAPWPTTVVRRNLTG